MPHQVGELLDELGAPWPLVRFVAHGASPEVQKERAQQGLAAHLDKQERKKGQRDELARALERVLLEQVPIDGHRVQKAGHRPELGKGRSHAA